jgi:predicted TIM-barrel fold metal-dependent hydrolase
MTILDGYCQILSTADDLLRRMDRLSIEQAVIHPPDECFAWENEAGNQRMLSAAKEHPDRLIPAVTVNPWRPDAWKVLKPFLQGRVIVAFLPGVQGFVPSEGRLDPILDRLDGRPVYVHTGHHSHGAPSQLAVPARRYPHLNFIMGHSGATDYATDVVPVCRVCPNIFIESSFARPLGFVRKLAEIGYERGLFGSGYPHNDLEFELSEMRRLLPPEHVDAVLGGNWRRLWGETK